MHVCVDHLRLMLVDDMEALRFALGRVLRLYGFEVCEATDGRDALAQVAGFRPQLVLTDLMMPVMDGVELIRQLRSDPETSAIPVMALTANTTDEASESAREAGAADVLAKPVDLSQLVERLRELSHAAEANTIAGAPVSETVRAHATGLGTCAPRFGE